MPSRRAAIRKQHPPRTAHLRNLLISLRYALPARAAAGRTNGVGGHGRPARERSKNRCPVGDSVGMLLRDCPTTGGGAVHALARAENDRICLSGSTPRACRPTGRFAHGGQLAIDALQASNKRGDKKEVDPNPSDAKVAIRKISLTCVT